MWLMKEMAERIKKKAIRNEIKYSFWVIDIELIE